MNLAITRRWKAGDATVGTLVVDGAPLCYTLEDVVRTEHGEDIHDVKVPGETAIPAGTYRVTMHQSPKFGRVPKLHDVPGFTDILIHAGNTAKDSRGCILVGMVRQSTSLQQSKIALDLLIPHLERATANGEEITIEIRESLWEPSA